MRKPKPQNNNNNDFFQSLTKPPSPQKISPRTPNQQSMFDAYADGKNILASGFAGTGKTLLSLYLALNDIMSNETPRDNIIIMRSVVPSRDMGFLPGNAKEKAKTYELPYVEICNQIFVRPNSYEALKTQKLVTFTTTSFLRGLTFTNAVVYIDEIQNLNFQEMNTVFTRIGEGCRVIVSGDIEQSDLIKEQSSFVKMREIIEYMPSFHHIEFGIEDVCRSEFVVEYMKAKIQANENGQKIGVVSEKATFTGKAI